MRILQIYTLVIFIGIYSSSFASYYAIQTCPIQTSEELKEELIEKGIQLITRTNIENYHIVDITNENQLMGFCYYSKLKEKDNHFSFITRKLIIKANNLPQQQIDFYHLKNHSFITNLFYMYPDVINDIELESLKKKLQENNHFEYISFNQIFTIDATVNDPLYSEQWSIENNGTPLQGNGIIGADMSVDSAWTITTGNPDIKIAVLDSGVDTLHEDLSANLLPGFDSYATNSINSYGHPIPNFSRDGHGTSCAGIIASIGNNNIGTVGIAFTSKIIPVRIFYYNDYGSGIGIQATTSTDALISGAGYAWRIAEADIISISAGLSNLFISALSIDTVLVNQELTDAFLNGRNGKGVAMFFSSGNDNINEVLWPANLSSTIAVGASSMCDERKNPSDCSSENWWGSSYGNQLDLVAPGVKISTTDISGADGYNSGNYNSSFNGTSAACPNAAGVGALALSVDTNLSSQDIKAILNLSADRIPNYIYDSTSIEYGTWNNEVGHGRINAYNAVKLAGTYLSQANVNNETNLISTNVYPNPTTGIFHINFSTVDNWNVSVINTMGQALIENRFLTTNSIQLNLDSPSGVYFLVISNNDFSKTIKLIKND